MTISSYFAYTFCIVLLSTYTMCSFGPNACSWPETKAILADSLSHLFVKLLYRALTNIIYTLCHPSLMYKHDQTISCGFPLAIIAYRSLLDFWVMTRTTIVRLAIKQALVPIQRVAIISGQSETLLLGRRQVLISCHIQYVTGLLFIHAVWQYRDSKALFLRLPYISPLVSRSCVKYSLTFGQDWLSN